MNGGFDLVEAMRFDPVDGVALLERHLARLTASAHALGFAFDRHGARNALQAATFRLDDPACVRLLLARSGAIAVQTGAVPVRAEPVTVSLVPLPDETDARLGHRTTDRGACAAPGESLFVSADGRIAPGSTTPFVDTGTVLLTPPVPAGHVERVLRAELIASGRAREAAVRVADLAHGFLIGGAVPGLLRATLG